MKKKILIIGGHDPSGGAGVMMDANICRLNECHPLTLITSETVQNQMQSKLA
jgi:hydroxymethylpyrimidine/phosphomethylpyrimidine kinase